MRTDSNKRRTEKILQWRLRPGGNYATTLESDLNWTDHCGKRKDRPKCRLCRQPGKALRSEVNDAIFEFRIRVHPCPSVVKK